MVTKPLSACTELELLQAYEEVTSALRRFEVRHDTVGYGLGQYALKSLHAEIKKRGVTLTGAIPSWARAFP